jgi:hypothetical protein
MGGRLEVAGAYLLGLGGDALLRRLEGLDRVLHRRRHRVVVVRPRAAPE